MATVLVVLVFVTGQVEARHACPKCGKQKSWAKRQQTHRHHQPPRLQTARQQLQQTDNRVRRVQHSIPLEAGQMPPSPPRFNVAQNPLDELQRELEEPGDDSSNSFLDDLDDISEALQDTAEDATNQPPDEADEIDDLLRGSDSLGRQRDNAQRDPLSALDEDAPPQEDAAEDDGLASAVTNPGLRNDAYYRSLGAPQTVAKRDRSNQPLTMGNIFGDEDEYDCQCQQRYCQSVWNCAGGRGQTWLDRMRRDRQRDNIIRNASANGCRPYKNEFKCPKVRDNTGQGQAFASGGAVGCVPGSSYQEQVPTPAIEYYDGGSYSDGIYDTGVIGEEYYDLQPSPAEIPLPMVDES